MTATFTFDILSSLDGYVARLKEESGVPLRSHGSLSLNLALLAGPGAGETGGLPGRRESVL